MHTIKTEALDHFVVFGETHLRHIVNEFVDYYNHLRPHQTKDNSPLTGANPPEYSRAIDPMSIICDERLGGLLKHCRRKAA